MPASADSGRRKRNPSSLLVGNPFLRDCQPIETLHHGSPATSPETADGASLFGGRGLGHESFPVSGAQRYFIKPICRGVSSQCSVAQRPVLRTLALSLQSPPFFRAIPSSGCPARSSEMRLLK